MESRGSASFATEFSSLIKAFPQQGYLSLDNLLTVQVVMVNLIMYTLLTKIMQAHWVGDQKLKHNNKLF